VVPPERVRQPLFAHDVYWKPLHTPASSAGQALFRIMPRDNGQDEIAQNARGMICLAYLSDPAIIKT